MPNSSRRTLASIVTASVAMGSRASAQLVLVIVTLVATRYLTPTMFGMFSLAAIGVTLIRSILWNGAFEYLLKARDPEKVATECLLINLLIVAACSLPLYLATFFADRLFGEPGIARLILLLLPSNLIAAIAAWQESLVLRRGRLKSYYAITFASEATSAAVAITLLLQGFGIMALVAQTYVRNIMVLAFYLAMRVTIWSRAVSLAALRDVLRWSVSRYSSVLLDFSMSYGADIFLGVLLSPAAAGLYRASNRIVTAVGEMFAHPAGLIARSVFSQRAAAGRDADDVWPLLFSAAAVVGWSAMAGLAVTAGLIVPLALGGMWRAAAPLVAIIAIARGGALLQDVIAALLVAYDRQNRLFLIQCGSTAATLAALAAVARFGVMPATIAVATVSLATSATLVLTALRAFPAARSLFWMELPIIVVPMLATALAAGAARAAIAGHGLPAGYAALITILCGVAAWALALVPLRRRVGRAFASLHA